MDQQNTIQNNKRNIFDVTIEIYKNYKSCIDKNLSPHEFVKIHYCDKKLFIDKTQENIFKEFFDVCSLEKLLKTLIDDDDDDDDDEENIENDEENIKDNNIEKKTEKVSRDYERMIYTYFILFYITPDEKDALLESMRRNLNKNTQENIIKFLSRNDMTLKFKQIQQDLIVKQQRYIGNEIEERTQMINEILTELRKNINSDIYENSVLSSKDKIVCDEEEEHKILSVLESPVVYNVLSSIHDDLLTNGKSSSFFKKFLKISKSSKSTKYHKNNIVSTSKSNNNIVNNNNLSTDCKNLKKWSSQQSVHIIQSIPVKQTITQILREGAQIRRKSEKAEKILNDICIGSFDPFKIRGLLEDVKRQQIEEDLQKIEKKHLMGKISLEEAKIAKLEQLERNKERVLELKKQRMNVEMKLEEFRRQEEERTHELIEKCHESWEIARQAQACELDRKKQIVKSVQEQSRRHANIIAMRRKKELEQKIALIRQIKELEQFSRNSRSNRTFIEHKPSSCSINSIMIPYSMSINELKESLSTLRKDIEENLKMQRNRIQEERLRQQKMILTTKSQIERYKGIKEVNNNYNGPKPKSIKLKITPDIMELQQTLNSKIQEVKNIQRRL